LGVLLGLRFKVGVLVLPSAAIVLGGTLAGPFMGRSIPGAFTAAFGAAAALQCGYLLGLSIICAASRKRQWPRVARRLVRNYGGLLTNPPPRAR
jgi:hypothetical protein